MNVVINTGNSTATYGGVANTSVYVAGVDERVLELIVQAEAKNTRLLDIILRLQEENTQLRLALATNEIKAITNKG